MAYSSLSAYLQSSWNYNISGPAVSSGINFPPPSASNTIITRTSYQLGSAAGLVQIVSTFIQAISASSSATINLTALTDVLGLSVSSMTKLKAWLFVLLNASQDSVNGTTCSSVAIGGGASNPFLFSLTGTTPAYTVTNGTQWSHGDPGASGETVSGTACNFKITNADSVNAAAVLVGLQGA